CPNVGKSREWLNGRNDRSGSFASILSCPTHVRFTPDSDRIADIPRRQLRANSRHCSRAQPRLNGLADPPEERQRALGHAGETAAPSVVTQVPAERRVDHVVAFRLPSRTVLPGAEHTRQTSRTRI